MEYINEHLYITQQDNVYFLNADDGYKFYDGAIEEDGRTYWTKRSLGFDKYVAYNYQFIDEATVMELEELAMKASAL